MPFDQRSTRKRLCVIADIFPLYAGEILHLGALSMEGERRCMRYEVRWFDNQVNSFVHGS